MNLLSTQEGISNVKRTISILASAAMLLMLIPAQASAAVRATVYEGSGDIQMKPIATYATGAGWDEGGAEIVAYDATNERAYLLNGAEKSVEIIDLSTLTSSVDDQVLAAASQVRLAAVGMSNISDITSVAVGPDGKWIALSLPAEPKTDHGYVAFLDDKGRFLSSVEVGVLPDMVGVTPDGKTVYTANEGEPSDDYSIDPEGSVSLIDVSKGLEALSQADVTTVRFDDESIIAADVRLGKPGATYAQDLEPEYATATADSKTLYVSLQENNAIAVLDLDAKRFTAVRSLGFKDHSILGQGLDASDKDELPLIRRWPVKGVYMPDGIEVVTVGGKTYLLTANEGDAREWGDFSDELRAKDLDGKLRLKAEHYAGFTQAQLDDMTTGDLLTDEQMGRLKVIADLGIGDDGYYDSLYSYGARSFTVWDVETMEPVFDSGDQLERIIHAAHPDYYNVSNTDAESDGRSDDKGPEPEDVETGWVGDDLYAFIGLERDGGIVAYRITDPERPQFSSYVSNREYATDEGAHSAPEGLAFVPAEQSPTGNALLLAGYEVSGTLVVYELTPAQQKTKITLLHTNDTHARAEEGDGMGFAKISTLAQQITADHPNTLLLDAGDTFHGTTFATLQRGQSIVDVMNEVGYDAMAAGNHDFNYGYERLLELDGLARFPVMSANVRYEDGTRLLDPYVIREVDGIKLGLFGLTTPETTYKTHPDNVKGLIFTDPAEEAKRMVAELRGRVDVIIAVTHLGIDASSTDTSIKVAREAQGIDVIVDGHSHSTLVEGLQGDHNTLIVSSGEYTKNLGVVELVFDEHKKLVSKQARLITKDDAAHVEPDPAVLDVIEAVKDEQALVLSEVIGHTAVRLEGEREYVRTSETNLGNLITDAMLDVTGADVAMTNGGGIRASIDVGEITKGEVITVLPFGNYIITKQVSGADLKAALENGASAYPDAKGAFAHVGGMTYEIDPARPAGDRVHTIMVQGQKLDEHKTYTLATNDFMAAGGDEYTMLAEYPITGEYPALDEALIAYIQKIGTVNAAVAGRITATATVDGNSNNPDSVPSVGTPAEPGSLERSGQQGRPSQGADQEPSPGMTPTTGADQQGTSPSVMEESVYIVQQGDTLWAIGRRYGFTWQELAETNRLSNPHLIFPGQRIELR